MGAVEDDVASVPAIAEREPTKLIPLEGRRAIRTLKDHLGNLPEDAPCLVMPSAIDAWRALREADPSAFVICHKLVRDKCGRTVADIIDERIRATPAETAARKPLDWTALSLLEAPPRRWATTAWLGLGHSTLLAGQGGIGKSQLVQQWGSCMSIAHAFIDEIPAPLVTLMWACEDDHDELWRRQERIAEWLGVGIEAFAGKFVIEPRFGLDNTLFSTEYGKPMFTPVLAELEAQANDYRAQVVILDNIGQTFGANENVRHDVTMFLNALGGTLPGRAVLLLAHPSRAPGSEYAGVAAWENVCRGRLYLGNKLPDQRAEDADPADGVRFLARRKANYSPRDWRRFTYREGVLVPDEGDGGVVDSLRRKRADRVLLEAARKLAEMGVRYTDGTSSPQFLPRLAIEYKLGEGCTKTELVEAMRRAMVDGKLRRDVVGRYGNRSPMHGLVVAEG